jgi:20S proteasome alpha/beta subunit
MELLEEKYKESMAQDDAMILGLEGLQKASEGEKLDARAIEIGLIVEGDKFRRLSESEVGQYLTRLPAAS